MNKILALFVTLLSSVAYAQEYELPTAFRMVVYPAVATEAVPIKGDSYPTPNFYVKSYFQGYYLSWIEDATDVLDGGWPVWQLDRAQGHIVFDYNYFAYLSADVPLDVEQKLRVEYVINSAFVGQVATCQDINEDMVTELKMPVTNEHVQEAIWSIVEEIPIENLPCPVDQVVELAYNNARSEDRCGPGYRLYAIYPTYPWGGAAEPSTLIFTLFSEVPCEEDATTNAVAKPLVTMMEAK
jgi:hypothetical protein